MFQSPQWGSNSKGLEKTKRRLAKRWFQSPQWGSNSKVWQAMPSVMLACFSPRNGEVILKGTP